MAWRRFVGPWLGVLLTGFTVVSLGFHLVGVCTQFGPFTRDCIAWDYAGLGLVLMLLGTGLAVAGVGLTAYPSGRTLPNAADLPPSSPMTPVERRLQRRAWALLSIALLAGLILLEIVLIRDVPVGYEIPGGVFVYYPAFLWSLVPIVVSDSFVGFMVWSYLARR